MSVPSPNALPVVSSATIAASEGATTTVPVFTQNQVNQDLTNTINSPYVATNGTPAATLTTTNSQGTPSGKGQFGLSTAPSSGIGFNPNTTTSIGLNPTPKQTVGVSTPADDGTAPNSNTVQTAINQFSGPIYPEPNVLDQFASYTYSLSLYLLSAQDARDTILAGARNIANWKLLIQSGGIPTTDRFSTDPSNQIFSNDYYLDNLEILTTATLGGTKAVHSAFDMSFTITEPNGITLVQNLYQAADQLYKQTGGTGAINYIDSTYCMVIKFYGYDQDGKLAMPIKGGLVNQGGQGATTTANTDNKAVIEKFYPIRFTELSFRNVKKQVEYKIKAAPLGQFYGRGQSRGTAKFPINLSGETVGQVLVGKSASVTVSGYTDGRESTTTSTPVNTPAQPFATSGIPTVDPNNPVVIAPTTPTLVGP